MQEVLQTPVLERFLDSLTKLAVATEDRSALVALLTHFAYHPYSKGLNDETRSSLQDLAIS